MNVNNIEKPFEGSLAFYKLKIMILKVNFVMGKFAVHSHFGKLQKSQQ